MGSTKSYRSLPYDQFMAARNANSPSATNPFATMADLSSFVDPIHVANYSELPDPTTVPGAFYYADASQGTKWLPGSLGGTYYPSGFYYSDGSSTWIYSESPGNATQLTVDAGTNNDQFLTPLTFENAAKWNSKSDVGHIHLATEVELGAGGLTLDELASTGLYQGGVLTLTGGVGFNVSSGIGVTFNNGSPITVTWSGLSGTTLYPGENYIYINSVGALAISTSFPDENSIKVGFIYTDTTNSMVLGYSSLGNPIRNFDRIVHDFFRKAVGTLVVSGNSVSEKSSPDELQLVINSGELFSQGNFILTNQTSTFFRYYNSADNGFVLDNSAPLNEINVTQWNDSTQNAASALVTMTNGYYKKDLIVRTPTGIVIYLFGTSEWSDIDDARNSALPIIPAAISGGSVKLAYVIVQKNDTTIASGIRDIRPLLSRIFDSGIDPSTSVVSDHGALSGLGDDDHPQYHNDTRGDIRYYTKTILDSAAGNTGAKQDKEVGKGLSANDLTNALKAAYDQAVTNSHTHSNKLILDAITASFTTTHETKLGYITITQAVDLDAIETRVNELDAAVILKGTWSPLSGSFPGGGVAQAGWSYLVISSATVDGVEFSNGDRIICVVDNASTTTYANNWYKADYTDRVNTVAGRTGNVVITSSDLADFASAALAAAPAETTTTIGALINSATNKPTPIDADYLGLMDSASGNILKKLSWANLKSTLKTYFDVFYAGGTAVRSVFISEMMINGTALTSPTTTAATRSFFSGTGVWFWQLRGGNNQDDGISFTFQVPYNYSSGGSFVISLTTDVTLGNVKLFMGLAKVNAADSYATLDETGLSTVFLGLSLLGARLDAIINPNTTTFSGGDVIAVKIWRDPDDAQDTALAASCYINSVQFVYNANV